MPPKLPKTAATLLLLMLLASGCQSSRPPLPIKAQDNTEALLAHPEFRAAAEAAPNWTTQALHIITRLETELGNAGHP